MDERSIRATGNAGGLTFELSEDFARALSREARRQHKSRAEIIKQALENYLEDQYFGAKATEVLESNSPTYTLDEVKKRLGLDN